MKPKVYVETSVIGYLTSWPSGDLIVAARQKITRDWWRDAPARYDLIASERVVSEASTGNPKDVQDGLAVLQALPMLSVTQEAEDLANALLAAGAVPIGELSVAHHIALSVVAGIEYLVTWNFKHLANASMRWKINDVCMMEGYGPPLICSPEQLAEEKAITDDPIVAEIRKTRNEHAAKFNYDIAAICEDIRRQEKESGREYVSYPPRRPEPPAKAAGPKAKPKRRKKRAKT